MALRLSTTSYLSSRSVSGYRAMTPSVKSSIALPKQMNATQAEADRHDDRCRHQHRSIRKPAYGPLRQVRKRRQPRVYAYMKEERRHAEQVIGQLRGGCGARQQIQRT